MADYTFTRDTYNAQLTSLKGDKTVLRTEKISDTEIKVFFTDRTTATVSLPNESMAREASLLGVENISTRFTVPRGEIFGYSRLTASASTTLTNANEGYVINGVFAHDDKNESFTTARGGTLTYSSNAITLQPNARISVSSDRDCKLKLYLCKNGSELTDTTLSYDVVNGGEITVYTEGIVDITTDDYIDLKAESDVAGTVLTVSNMLMKCKEK